MSPQEWYTMERIRNAGCPVDLRNLSRPSCPIHVSQLGDPDRNVVLGPLGLTILMRLRIIAFAPVTLCGFRMDADWLEQELTWVPRCAQHRGYICLHELHFEIPEKTVLTNRVFEAGTLNRGHSVTGLLLGQSAQTTAPPGSSCATLLLQLLSGEDLPFRVNIRNTTI